MSIDTLGSGRDRRYKVRWREGGKARSRTFNRKQDAETSSLKFVVATDRRASVPQQGTDA